MLNIQPIPAFDDNYIWLLSSSQSQQACIVDPGDAAPVLATLERLQLELTSILITHKHPDHVGGIQTLLAAYPHISIFGPNQETIPHITHPIDQSHRVKILDTEFEILDIPGHTEGHIGYYDGQHLFCGDTLFAGGCGRVFGGTHKQLYHSLERIAQLPKDTLIYCAHEYTLDNLGFAQWVEPDNPALAKRLLAAQEQRAQGQPTVPSCLQLELETNPFLRTQQPQVRQKANQYRQKTLTQGADIFHAIRHWKDKEYD